MQQGRVGGPHRGGDTGVALVAGRPDRVIPAAPAAQPAGREIEVAAAQLGVEQRQEVGGVAGFRVWWRVQRRDRRGEVVVDRFGVQISSIASAMESSTRLGRNG
jgi:hypothetical protein